MMGAKLIFYYTYFYYSAFQFSQGGECVQLLAVGTRDFPQQFQDFPGNFYFLGPLLRFTSLSLGLGQ
jgi:hypothetical protein